MHSLLLVEDSPKDSLGALAVARLVGFTEVHRETSAVEAKMWLEDSLQKGTLPDAIVLDLDLGYESGFEVMRFWHSTPFVRECPLVVWTILDGNYAMICNFFKVDTVVQKADGLGALEDALRSLGSRSASLTSIS